MYIVTFQTKETSKVIILKVHYVPWFHQLLVKECLQSIYSLINFITYSISAFLNSPCFLLWGFLIFSKTDPKTKPLMFRNFRLTFLSYSLINVYWWVVILTNVLSLFSFVKSMTDHISIELSKIFVDWFILGIEKQSLGQALFKFL